MLASAPKEMLIQWLHSRQAVLIVCVIYQDYNCSVEFFRSPFLVQEWETPNRDGSKNETLRLDLVERSSDRYKDADILIFNSGHWWTHQKTASG